MSTIVEKRGYRKEYDADGKLISKVLIGSGNPIPQPAPQPAVHVEEPRED